MAVITFSRELLSFADELAESTAKSLGYGYVDRHSLEKSLDKSGMPKKMIERYDEKKPGFWASLSQDRDRYFHLLKTVLYAEAAKGDCVFVGRASTMVFKDVPAALSVRVVAPMKVRVKRAMERYLCDEERARKILEKSDSDRSGFHRYFFDSRWNDSANYDLVVNTGSFDLKAAERLILQAAAVKIDPSARDKCSKRIAELNLSQAAVEEVVYTRAIPVHFFEADANGTELTLHGVSNSDGAREAAVKAAESVPGVTRVSSDIQIVQEYSMMP